MGEEEDRLNNILTSHWTEIKEIKKRLDELESKLIEQEK